MPKPNQYRVRFGRKTGAFCNLHFKDGVSRETVAGQHDWRFIRLRGVWGASRVELIPAETEAPTGPVVAEPIHNYPATKGAGAAEPEATPAVSAAAPTDPPVEEKKPTAAPKQEKQSKANGSKKAK